MSSKKTGSRRWSLSVRLTVWYIAASLTFAAFTMGGLYWWLNNYLDTREAPILIEKVGALREILGDRPDATLELKRVLGLDFPARNDEVPIYIRLLDENGQPRLVSKGMDSILPTCAAISVNHFLPEAEFRGRIDDLIEQMHSCPRAAGVERIYVPGEIEVEVEKERRARGIPVSSALAGELRALGAELAVDPPC